MPGQGATAAALMSAPVQRAHQLSGNGTPSEVREAGKRRGCNPVHDGSRHEQRTSDAYGLILHTEQLAAQSGHAAAAALNPARAEGAGCTSADMQD